MIVIMPSLIQRVATILNANLTQTAIHDFFAERQSNSQVRRPSPPLFSSRPVTRGYSRPYVMGARASVGPSHASSPRTARRAKTVAPSMSTSPHLEQTHTR